MFTIYRASTEFLFFILIALEFLLAILAILRNLVN